MKKAFKILILSIAVLFHIAAIIFSEQFENTSIIIFLSFSVYVPVILFGVFYGFKGGLISSFLLMVFNAINDLFISTPHFDTNILIGFYATYILSGMAIGYIADLNKKLTTTLNQKDIIIKESNHRISNNLSLIINLIRLQARSLSSKNENIKELFYDIEKRIESIGLIHNQLFKSDNINKIDFYNYITSLSESIISSFIEDKARIKVFVNIIRIEMEPDIFIPIGLIVTEIITNAVKYGFPNNKKGDIKILLVKNNSQYTLEVSNNGQPLPADFDFESKKTLGVKIISSLTQQLNGKITVSNEKEVKFKLSFSV